MNTKYLTPATANACHPTMMVSSLLRLHDSNYTGLTNEFSKLSYYWSAALAAGVGICSQNSSTVFQKEITNLYTGQSSPVLEVL